MQRLLDNLDTVGFSSLPFKEQSLDEGIPKDRAVYLFKQKRRLMVKKSDLTNKELRVFGAVEKKLIESSFGK
jgi:hypothetical protein